ncbi:hypothetical protein SELMODRAFT_409277 [Selaginella moellendorffii]|uniref:GST N-terminal domain-containing protein n=1 Tax=Selaginella moellendorffii TaxID=88036 RepID=D8RAY3_SELML|nr:hypothetical protein SELMODRAFT_409277 [Selaginella moellendorffii]
MSRHRSYLQLELFKLYEFEACPFCRRLYPCPKGSRVHRAFVKSSGGKEQFSFVLDPNTGVSMYESSDIVNYLFQEYGERSKPTFGILESLQGSEAKSCASWNFLTSSGTRAKGNLIAPSSSKSQVQHRFEVLESKDELDLIGQQPPEPLRQFNQRFQSYIRPNLIREQDTVSWDKFCPIRDAETAC